MQKINVIRTSENVTVFCFPFLFSDMEKLQQKVQQYQTIIQKQQMKMKTSVSASSSISRPTPGEVTGAETTATQGW